MMKPSIVVAGVCSLLFCVQAGAAEAPAAGVNATAASSQTEAEHRRNLDAMYLEQDGRLQEARPLVKGGKFTEAINNNTQVMRELILEVRAGRQS